MFRIFGFLGVIVKLMKIRELIQVISVDKEKCVNCHVCINACPVKYCNDGSGETVRVNHNLCIACGNCLSACTHDARKYMDDFHPFMENLKKGERMVAIVAPSVASNFPNLYLNLNGWLKKLGIEAIFDVSFGAELTVASYIDHIKKNSPQTVITQPCPAIVTFIEIFKPELLEYLAPVDSPMLHTMKLIKNYYPAYKNHKIVVISPCLAKKREFLATGLGDYNISYLSIQKFLTENSISLVNYPQSDYDNPPAERAVLFSSPGGLLQTAERWLPEIRSKTRKIEGVHTIYDYLETLPRMILEKKSPLLIDCLNCEKGCNGGSLTLAKDKPVDEIEYLINTRNDEMQKLYKEKSYATHADVKTHLENLLAKYWKPDLYDRKYENNSLNNIFKFPDENEIQEIYHKMHKYSEDDFYNCSSCGYGKCEKMAFAIFNGLNRAENCHFYLSKEGEIAHNATTLSQKRLETILNTMVEGFVQIDSDGKITHHNPALAKILKTDDIINKKISDFLDGQNKEILNTQLKLREQHKQSSYEIAFSCEDGSTVYCILNGCPFYDENGNKSGSFGIITDITLRKMAEKELKASRDELERRVIERTQELTEIVEELRVSQEVIEKYNQELENLSIVASKTSNGVLIMDETGKIEWFNNGYSNMFGFTYEEFSVNLNKNFLKIAKTDSARDALVKCMESKHPVIYESQGMAKDETKIWTQVALTPILNDSDVITKLVAVTSNITELKQAEEEIRLQNEEISSQRDAIEQRAQELTDALEQLKQSQAKLIESEKMVALGQLIAGVAHEINTPLGAIRSSVGNISNTLQQILTKLPDFFRAITEEEKNNFFSLLDKSLKTKNNLTSKEERVFKRKIVQVLEEHKIQSPENFADTFVDMCIYDDIDQFLVLLKSKQNTEIIEMAYKLSGLLRSSQTITTATDRASKVVFALKNFAHYDNSGEMIKADVVYGIETVLTLYYNQLKHGINVIRNFNEIPQILCYPDELNQVWTNLIHNAIQAMDNKGDLTIDVSCNHANVFISFTDTGNGIPVEIQDKIFKPFFTTKPQGEGSGLGLDIVRRIIEKHNGEIMFESKPGKTTFTVKLKK